MFAARILPAQSPLLPLDRSGALFRVASAWLLLGWITCAAWLWCRPAAAVLIILATAIPRVLIQRSAARWGQTQALLAGCLYGLAMTALVWALALPAVHSFWGRIAFGVLGFFAVGDLAFIGRRLRAPEPARARLRAASSVAEWLYMVGSAAVLVQSIV